MTHAWDPVRAAAFYDEYGEREWARFEDGRESVMGLGVYIEHLRRFVSPGDRVLEIGAGPGRFTIELARIGADVLVADLSPGQLDLNRKHVVAAGAEERVLGRVVADVTDLTRWEDAAFDVVVCYGGPLSYVLDRAEGALAELVRVTKPGRHVLLSVMSLIGPVVHNLQEILDLIRRDGASTMEEFVRTGFLPEHAEYGHLAMKLYRWSELETLLSRHGTIVAAAAAGLLPAAMPEEPELREFLSRVELGLMDEPGAVSCGRHIVAVLRRDPWKNTEAERKVERVGTTSGDNLKPRGPRIRS